MADLGDVDPTGRGERRVSAGCAGLSPHDEATSSLLVATADVALSMAKRAGRNRVVAAQV